MAHGSPDWNRNTGIVENYQLTDLGEVAARINPAFWFDRRGELVHLDDFESSTEKWTFSNGGRSTQRSWRGDGSAKLTTTATQGNASTMNKQYELNRFTRQGLALMYSTDDVDDFDIEVTVVAGHGLLSVKHSIKIEYRAATNSDNMYYLDSNGDYQQFRLLAPGSGNAPGLWLPLKVVWDWDQGEYVRVLEGIYSDDLSGISGQYVAYTYFNTNEVTITLTTQEAVAHDLYIDDVILTMNEP